jgi:hypothetical protein
METPAGFAFRWGHMKLDTRTQKISALEDGFRNLDTEIWGSFNLGECLDPPKVGMNQRRFNNTKGAQHRKWDDTASNLT